MRIDLPNPQIFTNIFQEVTGVKPTQKITGVATDSRDVSTGDLYIAIRGERTDGHRFLSGVFERGAACALVSKPQTGLEGQQVVVHNPVSTIGKIARTWRAQFDLPVIAITGSNGKTSTKELLRHVLSEKFLVHATEENFNTSIGLPLTLLTLNEAHTCSLLEMGANQPGDIKTLCKISQPTHGIITNIAPAHLEGFGSIEAVAQTKRALFESLSEGIAFVNHADPRIKELPLWGAFISFGLTPDCDYSADIHHEGNGSITLIVETEEIPTGSRNLSFAKNVIAVAAIAHTIGITWNMIRAQVQSFQPPSGRCVVKQARGLTIIDDTYNANLESTLAAIDYLTAFTGNGQRILIFGDMFELGDSSHEQHRKVGQKCMGAGLSAVLTVGKETEVTDTVMNGSLHHEHFHNKEALLVSLKKLIVDGDKILVKGSRGMAMETIVEALLGN